MNTNPPVYAVSLEDKSKYRSLQPPITQLLAFLSLCQNSSRPFCHTTIRTGYECKPPHDLSLLLSINLFLGQVSLMGRCLCYSYHVNQHRHLHKGRWVSLVLEDNHSRGRKTLILNLRCLVRFLVIGKTSRINPGKKFGDGGFKQFVAYFGLVLVALAMTALMPDCNAPAVPLYPSSTRRGVHAAWAKS